MSIRSRLLAWIVFRQVKIRYWVAGGPPHVFIQLVNGEYREVDPDLAAALLDLLRENGAPVRNRYTDRN